MGVCRAKKMGSVLGSVRLNFSIRTASPQRRKDAKKGYFFSSRASVSVASRFKAASLVSFTSSRSRQTVPSARHQRYHRCCRCLIDADIEVFKMHGVGLLFLRFCCYLMAPKIPQTFKSGGSTLHWDRTC